MGCFTAWSSLPKSPVPRGKALAFAPDSPPEQHASFLLKGWHKERQDPER